MPTIPPRNAAQTGDTAQQRPSLQPLHAERAGSAGVSSSDEPLSYFPPRIQLGNIFRMPLCLGTQRTDCLPETCIALRKSVLACFPFVFSQVAALAVPLRAGPPRRPLIHNLSPHNQVVKQQKFTGKTYFSHRRTRFVKIDKPSILKEEFKPEKSQKNTCPILDRDRHDWACWSCGFRRNAARTPPEGGTPTGVVCVTSLRGSCRSTAGRVRSASSAGAGRSADRCCRAQSRWPSSGSRPWPGP